MGSKVDAKHMSRDRLALLDRANGLNSSLPKSNLITLIVKLTEAARECPNIKCATCSFMAQHDAERLPDTTTGD